MSSQQGDNEVRSTSHLTKITKNKFVNQLCVKQNIRTVKRKRQISEEDDELSEKNCIAQTNQAKEAISAGAQLNNTANLKSQPGDEIMAEGQLQPDTQMQSQKDGANKV